MITRCAILFACAVLSGCIVPQAFPSLDADEDFDFPDAEPGGDATRRDADARADTGIRDVDAGVDPDTGIDVDMGPPPDLGPRDPLANLPAAQQIGGNYGICEGPTWRPEGSPVVDNVVLWTDIAASIIWQAGPPNWQPAPFRQNADQANGLANNTSRLLLACEHQTRRVSLTLANGTRVTLADNWNGMAFNSPNDLVVRSDNTVYFTDPPYGLAGRPREIPFNGIFRITPNGTVSAEWMGQADPPESLPNGIDLSPDERTLYVADSAYGIVMAFDVSQTGTISNQRTFATPTGMLPDGINVDEEGHVYVASSDGVEVFEPTGERLGAIVVPGCNPSNLSFGGPERRTMFITCGSAVTPNLGRMFRIDPVNIPGAR